MDHTREDFLRAIRTTPDDDTARLVYADWLQEHNDEPWARFIRLQVEIDRRPKPGDPAALEEAVRLLNLHGNRWREQSRTLGNRIWEDPDNEQWSIPCRGLPGWRRGLPSSLVVDEVGLSSSPDLLGVFAEFPIEQVLVNVPRLFCAPVGERPGTVTYRRMTEILFPIGAAVWDEVVRLAVSKPRPSPRVQDIQFTPIDDAVGVVSRAIVNFGRDAVGLPKLYGPEAESLRTIVT